MPIPFAPAVIATVVGAVSGYVISKKNNERFERHLEEKDKKKRKKLFGGKKK